MVLCKYKDFFCGVFFASATWTLFIILYFDSISFKEKQKDSGSRLRLVARYERPKLEHRPQDQNSSFVVNSSDPGFIHNERDFEFRQEGYKKYAFNALISERIGDFRDIPDTRHALWVLFPLFIHLFVFHLWKYLSMNNLAKLKSHAGARHRRGFWHCQQQQL